MTAPVLTGTGAAFVTGTGSAHVTQRGDDRVPTCVEIGWGWDVTGPGQGAGNWDDVTAYVMELSTSRGRQQELQRFESGTLTVKLDNRDGRFNPWNTVGAYGSGAVRVGCPIRVRISAEKSDPTGSSPALATYDPTDGGFYYAWWGFVTNIDPGWSQGGVVGTCTVQAADLFALLNRADLIAQTFPEAIATTQGGTIIDGVGFEFADDRLVGCLDGSGVKLLFGGAYIYRTTWTHFGDPAPFSPLLLSGVSNPVTSNMLQYLGDISDAGFIDLYATPWNVLAWRGFSEIRNTAFDTTTIFGDNVPTEIPYLDVGPAYDDQNLYNDVSITFDGPSTQSANDTTSIGTYGRRKLQRTFPVQGASVAAVGPDDFVTRYKDPIVRVPSITVSLRSLTNAQRMRVLSLPIGYRVHVVRRPSTGDAITAECYFEGMQLTWLPGMVDVKATLALAPVRPINTYVDPIPS